MFFPKEKENLSCYYLISQRLSAQPWAIGFLRQKVWAFFLCEDFLGEISKPPTNKDFAFVTVPFSFILQ